MKNLKNLSKNELIEMLIQSARVISLVIDGDSHLLSDDDTDLMNYLYELNNENA